MIDRTKIGDLPGYLVDLGNGEDQFWVQDPEDDGVEFEGLIPDDGVYRLSAVFFDEGGELTNWGETFVQATDAPEPPASVSASWV